MKRLGRQHYPPHRRQATAVEVVEKPKPKPKPKLKPKPKPESGAAGKKSKGS